MRRGGGDVDHVLLFLMVYSFLMVVRFLLVLFAAVFLEMQEYEKCINVCEEAIARGREKFTPFEELAK